MPKREKRTRKATNEFSIRASKLWPMMIAKGTAAFDDDFSLNDCATSARGVSELDAIYQLLNDTQESFIYSLSLRR